jgi:hypothetical protein
MLYHAGLNYALVICVLFFLASALVGIFQEFCACLGWSDGWPDHRDMEIELVLKIGGSHGCNQMHCRPHLSVFSKK